MLNANGGFVNAFAMATQQKAIASIIQRVKLNTLAGSVESIEVNIVKALRYKKGARQMSEWQLYRLDDEVLAAVGRPDSATKDAVGGA